MADSADTTGFYDGNTTGTDYRYDGNGNMVEDKNKKITISYTYLNLTVAIFGNGNMIYIYYAGNTRVVFSDVNEDGVIDRGLSTAEILQRTDYYPFGMSFADMQGGDNKYL